MKERYFTFSACHQIDRSLAVNLLERSDLRIQSDQFYSLDSVQIILDMVKNMVTLPESQRPRPSWRVLGL